MYQRILIPLDGSKQAESALPLAGKLARIYNAEVTLLRVVEYPFEMYCRCEPNSFEDPAQVHEKLQTEKTACCKDAEDYLKRLASTIEMTVSRVSVEIQEGPVIDAILSTVDKSKIDLIVMSTVGQDESPWLMGAITNRILREAPVPVILIRKGSYDSASGHRPRQSSAVKEAAWTHPGTLAY